MNVTISVEITVFLVFCLGGLAPAVLSWRMAHLMYIAMGSVTESKEVMAGAAHYRRDQFLLVAGWSIFLAVGVFAVFIPRPSPSPPLTVIGVIVTWMLIGSFGVWAMKTMLDFLYTRSLWVQRRDHAVQSARSVELTQATEDQASLALTAQEVTAEQLNVITVVVEDTNDQVHDIKSTATKTNIKNDIRMSNLEDAMKAQTSGWRQFFHRPKAKE